MALPEGFASSCRLCGSPIHPEGQKCGHCGESYAEGGAARHRLRIHRARMVRALERLRAGVAFRVATSLTQRHLPKVVLLVLGGILVTLAAAMVVTVVSVLMQERLGTWAWVVIGAAVFLALGGVVGSFVSALVLLRVLAGRADRMARRCVRDWAATSSLSCPTCQGRFETVVYAQAQAVPCPWCDAEVESADGRESDPTVTVARETAMRHKSELGPKAYRHLMRKLGRRPLRTLRVPLEGFRSRAGLISGEPEGVSLWSSLEYVDSEPTLRVEVDAPTGHTGLWFVRPEVESDLRAAGELWGVSLPEISARAAFRDLPGWMIYAEPGEVPLDANLLEGLLAVLGPRDALLVDAGGLSVWRRSGNFVALFRPWVLLRDSSQELLAVAHALRQQPGQLEPAGAGPRPIESEDTTNDRAREGQGE